MAHFMLVSRRQIFPLVDNKDLFRFSLGLFFSILSDNCLFHIWYRVKNVVFAFSSVMCILCECENVSETTNEQLRIDMRV